LLVSINVLAIVIIGGMGSIPGVIIGAFILIGLPDILQFSETADLLSHFEWLRTSLNRVIDAFNAISPWNLNDLPPASEWGEDLAEKRFIIFGALLVIVMLLRPEGIFPSRRRQLEFENPPEAETGPVAT
jgi:branched-chain amino acid transport system permease protein